MSKLNYEKHNERKAIKEHNAPKSYIKRFNNSSQKFNFGICKGLSIGEVYKFKKYYVDYLISIGNIEVSPGLLKELNK